MTTTPIRDGSGRVKGINHEPSESRLPLLRKGNRAKRKMTKEQGKERKPIAPPTVNKQDAKANVLDEGKRAERRQAEICKMKSQAEENETENGGDEIKEHQISENEIKKYTFYMKLWSKNYVPFLCILRSF